MGSNGRAKSPAYRLMLLQVSGDATERARGSLRYLLHLGRQFERSGRHRGKYTGRRWIDLNVQPALGPEWRPDGVHCYTRF